MAAPSVSPGPGLIGQLLYSLGYVPKSQYDVTTLQNTLAQLGQQVQAVQSQDATVLQSITSAKALIAGLTAQLQTLTGELTTETTDITSQNDTIGSLESLLSTDTSTITSLKSLLSTDTSTISSYQSKVSAAVASLNALTTLSATPSFTLQDNGLISGDVTGDVVDFDGVSQVIPSGDDSGITAFVDQGVTGAFFDFDPGFQGLSAAGSAPAMQAVGVPAGIGSNIATALGYIPTSQALANAATIVSLQGQISTATSNLQSAQSTLTNDQSTLASLTGQQGPLQSEISAAQSSHSADQSQIAALTGAVTQYTNQHQSNLQTIANLQSNHSSNLQTIADLQSNLSSITDVLSRVGSTTTNPLPISVSWNFGDGSTPSTLTNPSYGWSTLPTVLNTQYNDQENQASVTYQPSVTITVTVPATVLTSERTITKTFQTRPITLAVWPTQINLSDPCGSYCTGGDSYTLGCWVEDRNGVGIPNTRVFFHGSLDWLIQTGQGFATTDATGYISFSLDLGITFVGGVHCAIRSLRNASVAASPYNKTIVF